MWKRQWRSWHLPSNNSNKERFCDKIVTFVCGIVCFEHYANLKHHVKLNLIGFPLLFERLISCHEQIAATVQTASYLEQITNSKQMIFLMRGWIYYSMFITFFNLSSSKNGASPRQINITTESHLLSKRKRNNKYKDKLQSNPGNYSTAIFHTHLIDTLHFNRECSK